MKIMRQEVSYISKAAVLATLAIQHLNSLAEGPQLAAKVNGVAIYSSQVEAEFNRQLNLKSSDPEQISKDTVLNQLIDEQLLAQDIQKEKAVLENPYIQAALDRARSGVLASAAKELSKTPTPTEEEMSNYYQKNPGLFANRRIYAIQELRFTEPIPDPKALEKSLGKAKSLPDFVSRYAKPSGINFNIVRVTQAAEGIPLDWVETFSKQQDGSLFLVKRKSGLVSVIYIEASKDAPVSYPSARAAIYQFLLVDSRNAWAVNRTKELRQSATIEVPSSSNQ